MFQFFKRPGAVKELDRIIAELNMNMQNNYKDAAQEAARAGTKTFRDDSGERSE